MANSTTDRTLTKFYTAILIAVVWTLCSCSAERQIVYIQDITTGDEVVVPANYQIRIKPLDQITVVINSRDPLLAEPFNSSTSYASLSASGQTTNSSEASLQIMTVDEDGYITLPVIGRIKCQGLTRHELEEYIEQRIREENYIAEPQANVRFAKLCISVLGEVNHPGRYDIERDNITIFDALALAGDMTIYGKRNNVAIIREVDGRNTITRLDLRSSDIFTSPCYYLEQNDIVIVSPNKQRAASSQVNQNRTFWTTLASLAISLATLLITVIN